MTVSSELSRVVYATDGVTDTFSVPFRFLQASDLRVCEARNDALTLLKAGLHYSVAGANAPAGGTLAMNRAPAAGGQLVIVRVVPLTQETAYPPNDPFPAAAHERALDKLTMITQQLAEGLSRVVKLPLSFPFTFDELADFLFQAHSQAAASAHQANAAAAAAQTAAETAQTAAAAAVTVASTATLPGADIGPVIVADVSEVWVWVSTAHYTGYRSPLCGRPVDGHTVVPLAGEIDAVGGLVSKFAYAGLWGYAQENNLVVSQSQWNGNIGAHWFVDVSASQFRVPDLRNQFRRFTGTDADSGNARALGAWKTDTLKSHRHSLVGSSHGGYNSPDRISFTGLHYGENNKTTLTGTAETAPTHVAYHPRIHV